MTEFAPRIELPELAYRISWAEWVQRWNACTDQPTAIGLLHTIFDIEKEERPYPMCSLDTERMLLLLDMADRHGSDQRGKYPNPHVRDKAFAVLSNSYFKHATEEMILSLGMQVRDKLIWFFLDQGSREKYEGGKNVRWHARDNGTPHAHALKVASEYLALFCKVHWRRGGLDVRNQVLEILYYQDALSSLMPDGSGYWHTNEWDRFELHLEKLKEIALRDHTTVEQGIRAGSVAAQLYHLALVSVSEGTRVREEERLRGELAEVNHKLKQIAR